MYIPCFNSLSFFAFLYHCPRRSSSVIIKRSDIQILRHAIATLNHLQLREYRLASPFSPASAFRLPVPVLRQVMLPWAVVHTRVVEVSDTTPFSSHAGDSLLLMNCS